MHWLLFPVLFRYLAKSELSLTWLKWSMRRENFVHKFVIIELEEWVLYFLNKRPRRLLIRRYFSFTHNPVLAPDILLNKNHGIIRIYHFMVLERNKTIKCEHFCWHSISRRRWCNKKIKKIQTPKWTIRKTTHTLNSGKTQWKFQYGRK